MGEQSLQGMKEMCGQNEYALLYWHLQSNHFPPIDTDFVETAQKALQYAREEDYEQQIEMPNGKTLEVREILDGMHLWEIIE
jgi:hypothetical protein|tara:strand:+ start:2235 stop:2480 length:246 start_codon:yes stop_codon:yes gene_type:complete